MTKKLYDENSFIRDFEATVLSCEKCEKNYNIILDKTAFFPEGGGQSSDTGFIGNAKILDVQIVSDKIIHISDRELEVGKEYECSIDWKMRFRKMQNHTGEHIISGLAHTHFKCENVGFHLGSEAITIDFDKKLDFEDIAFLEQRANNAVFCDLPVKAYYPKPEELEKMNYRSKLDLQKNVRIVDIFSIDLCACCAPHVKRTGQVGIIKILDFQNYKGGVRLYISCGFDALDDYIAKSQEIKKISVLLSANQNQVAQRVQKLVDETTELKAQIAYLKKNAVQNILSALNTENKNLCIFTNDFDSNQMRNLCNDAVKLCDGICGVFSQNECGFAFVIASKSIDLKKHLNDINNALSAKGGGQSSMIQGNANADNKTIRTFIENFDV